MNLIQYLPARVIALLFLALAPQLARSQAGNCNTMQVGITTNESRCRATGNIDIIVTGGSGSYNYKVTGPITTSYTSANNISGLTPGIYSVFVRDIVNACVKQVDSVVILGTYEDPRFNLNATNVTCKDSRTGSLEATDVTGGRSQFWFTIITAPMPSDVGRANETGFFANLAPGEYAVQMEDSCGGIQTRRATILPYDWWVESHSGTMTACSMANFTINLRDSRGKTTPDSVFSGFRYGWVRGTNDTAWSTSPSFSANILNRRSVVLAVKDGCGNLATMTWTNAQKPAVDANVSTSQSQCNVFTATVTGVVNMNNPQFCLFNAAYDQIACNTTGVFTNLVQDNYTIEIRDLCYDTLIRRNFSLVNPKPDVNATPAVTRTSCTAFNVQVTGLVNFSNPQFCIFRNNVQVGACNLTGFFKNLPNGTYEVRITDGCYDTTVIRVVDVQPLRPSLSDNVNISNRTCTTFDVSVSGQVNLTSPQYSLWKGNVQLATNATGSFTALPYGDYCIRMVNSASCYDTTITRCFSGRPFLPAVAENLSVERDCNTMNLKVEGQQHLTNPQYCIFDELGNQLGCNTTGSFDDLAYGSYCIRIKNDPACYDTTIERCIRVDKEKPAAGPVVQSNASCLTFDAAFSGQFSVYNPVYRLKDSAGNTIDSNTTGVFTGLAYAAYCIEMQNDPLCYDTTITRCFTGRKPLPSGGSVSYSDQTCPSFTATVSGLVNFTNPQYRLRTASGILVDSNSTGVFTGLAYQDYCVEIINDPACYDTTVTRCFAAIPPVPAVGNVVTDGFTCGTFNARITGQYLLTNPVYNLKNTQDSILSTNNTGVFTELPYGTYTIEVVDGCHPQPFTRTFTATRPGFVVEATAIAACTQGMTTISINLRNGSQPYVVTVFDPGNNAVGNIVSNAGTVQVRDLPALPAGMQYRVVVVDSCGRTGTQLVTPVLSTITKLIQYLQRCPSGVKPNGSSDVIVTVSSNAGPVYPVIIRRNSTAVNINYSSQAGRTFRFLDLAPATYVIMYNLPNGCSNKLYDTIAVGNYQYPAIANAAVYQCSNNSFTVSAQLLGGAPSFQYQIIGSTPALPAISTPWQSSPVFTINNGTQYSLVRLRAIDACGNAAINDANVLPLQNLIISSTASCMYSSTVLSVDQVPNANYAWYRMDRVMNDSTFLGSTNSITVTEVMPADTGLYKVTMTLNNGCLERIATFTLTGECTLLPAKDIRLEGRWAGTAAALTWRSNGEKNLKGYHIEHSTDQYSGFRSVGQLAPLQPQGTNSYAFSHPGAVTGTNYYRIRAEDQFGNKAYSNTIMLNRDGISISVHPIPAGQVVYVNVTGKQYQDLRVQLYGLNGQLLQEKVQQRILTGTIPIYRQNYASGVYLLKVTDMAGGTVHMQKIMFE